MPLNRQTRGILVKARPIPPQRPLSLDDGALTFQVRPLFTSVGRRSRDLGAEPGSIWQILTPTLGIDDDEDGWDICHRLLRSGFGFDGAPEPEFAEPDFQQQWSVGAPSDLALALTADCKVKAQDGGFPTNDNPLWFKDPDHGQFEAALGELGSVAAERAVRIAHCDTGYDRGHAALPERLDLSRAHNFVDRDRPGDASDTSDGPLRALGHGTGTVGVLAGRLVADKLIGAAPFANVVPLRVANSVVLFQTSSIASGLDYVHSLRGSATPVHVVTMSMGGLPSQAWAEAINALYDAGVFVVTAAGNNLGNLPTRNIVYPARFNRVVAACGVMADFTAYADLSVTKMAGNYGPRSKMATAVAGYTPNIPWASFGCGDQVNLDGAGTSCATPQIAAAAAIWIQGHKAEWDAYSEGWMRVEAVRKALFETARKLDPDRLGQGAVRALAALRIAAPAADALKATPADSASFAAIRVFLGLGLAAQPSPREQMLELEALQLAQSAEIEPLLRGLDPSETPASTQLRQALAEHPQASTALRDALAPTRRRRVTVPDLPWKTSTAVEKLHLKHATDPQPPKPTRRRLRVYAYDPSLGTELKTLGINEAVLDVMWEDDLQPGPTGEYVEVVDVDPISQCGYAPVNLNDPRLLVQDGLAPSESNPQFQQQMVYAVTMRTIEHFERALGRVALWAPRRARGPGGSRTEEFVQRLRVYPHALRTTNAYYSPDRVALLLGYFAASRDDSGNVLPGGLVFTALSHDIVAHETTHALLDGLHPRFREPTNKDALAFHEAFADIVALFQHFAMPEALRQAIASTRGDLAAENLLAQLAVQFGQATRRQGALRDAIGTTVDGTWQPKPPKRTDYGEAEEAHDLGAVLVAAVFDAFLQIYRARSADLIRLATGGTGVLPVGAIPVDLVNRLASEASKVASHVLAICIRALDYCPPLDLTFGEYLRALITADRDLVPNDEHSYRVAFIAAFRDRGIYPSDVKSLSVGSLIWEPPPMPLTSVARVLDDMTLDWDLTAQRDVAYANSRANAVAMRKWLLDRRLVPDDELDALGFVRNQKAVKMTIADTEGELGPIEVHSVRPARRVGPSGETMSDLVVEITQTFRPRDSDTPRFRGGCTLLIDLTRKEVRYFVRKKVDHPIRFLRQQDFVAHLSNPLRVGYFHDDRDRQEPFALLHRGY